MQRHLPQVLDPDGLSAAAQAFQASLEAVDDSFGELRTYQLRQLLAQHIIEHALRGEHDPVRLQQAAVTYLKGFAFAP